jgi:hypothetical protein
MDPDRGGIESPVDNGVTVVPEIKGLDEHICGGSHVDNDA